MSVHNWGPQLQLGLSPSGLQTHPSVVTASAGESVVTWAETFGSQSGIALEILGPDGAIESDPDGFLQKGYLYVGGSDTTPSSFLTGAGGLGAVWNNSGNLWVTYVGTQGQVVPQALTGGTGGRTPAALGLAGDSVVVVYANNATNISIAKLTETANGGLTVTTRTANTATTGLQDHPDVAQLTSGYLAVVWVDENLAQVKLTSADPTGVPAGLEIVVTTPGELGSLTDVQPKVVALANGGFVVEYNTSETSFPGQGSDIRARLYTSGGVALGADFLVNSYTVGAQNLTAMAPLPDGGFLAFWYDAARAAVEGQHFDAFGARVDGLFTVAASTQPGSISAATLSDGRVSVAWDDVAQDSHLQIIDPRDGQVIGTSAADVLYAGDYGDQIQGFAGADEIHGGQGADTVYAGAGADVVTGGAGNDTLYGEADGDTLSGGLGDDVLSGGTGVDSLTGGPGSDVFAFVSYADSPASAPDTIADFTHGSDIIDLRGASGAFVALTHFANGATGVFFAPGASGAQGAIYVVGDVEAPDVLADAGTAFYIQGAVYAEALTGGAAADTIIGGGGADFILGGSGGDVFKYTAIADSPNGGSDLIGDFVHGSDKIDLTGGAAVSVNIGHDAAGYSYVSYAPAGAGSAYGTIVVAGNVQPSDLLLDAGVVAGSVGTSGADVLESGSSRDTLTGNGGADVFRVDQLSDSPTAAFDIISDFQHGIDKIDLSAVAGGFVDVEQDGDWAYVFFAPQVDGTAGGALAVHGHVTAADLGLAVGDGVVVNQVVAIGHANSGAHWSVHAQLF